jgi:esterase/lipase superfamily enzyme
VSSVDSEAGEGETPAPPDRAAPAVSRHLTDVVPLIRQLNPSHGIGVTGCSFGAYHAFTMALRHPDVFTNCVTMGGAFDLKRFLDGYGDADAYLLNPQAFLPGLSEPYYLDQFRRNKFVLATGEWDICRKANEDFSALLGARGIPHSLHVWGFGSKHDWPFWQPMANAYLP